VSAVVEEILDPDDDVVGEIARLVNQLSSRSLGHEEELIREAIASVASRVLVAREGGVVVGTLTLVVFTISSGRRAWIEDVVVDESARRQGVGEALVNAAVVMARTEGVRTVDLTSRPSRTDAHRLYEKMGFLVRETNVYRYQLEI
jgi:GNAT superfamily N-acetyltransferase